MGFLYHHGLISHITFESAVVACKYGTIMPDCNSNFTVKSEACKSALSLALKELTNQIDIYNVDADVCRVEQAGDGAEDMLQYTAQWSGIARTMSERRLKSGELRQPSQPTPTLQYEQHNHVDPCLSKYMAPYLNRADVQAALHADKTVWKLYGDIRYGTILDDMIPYYKEIFNHPRTGSWRILIFSGDFDAVVPLEATQRWIRCLGRPITKPWKAWMHNNQVAGSIIEYDRISFLTIKGSGHKVSYYTPDKGLAFFQRWINNQAF
jgi:serine carboxypeptidase-like clade 2